MSRDKQIEEMAEAIEQARIKATDTTNSMNYGFGGWYAKELYNAGYRKIYDDHERQCTCYALGCQMAEELKKEVAREIFDDCHNTLIKILNTVRDGLDKAIREGNEEAKLVHIGTEETVKCIILILAELKKKYTKEITEDK